MLTHVLDSHMTSRGIANKQKSEIAWPHLIKGQRLHVNVVRFALGACICDGDCDAGAVVPRIAAALAHASRQTRRQKTYPAEGVVVQYWQLM